MVNNDDFTVRDEANALTALAFRNGPLEALHAGKQSSELEDPEISRITNDEMKTLMINASQRLAELLHLRDADPTAYAKEIELGCRYTQGWVRDWPLKDAKLQS